MLIKNNDTLVVYNEYTNEVCLLTLLLKLPSSEDSILVEYTNRKVVLPIVDFNYECLIDHEILGIL